MSLDGAAYLATVPSHAITALGEWIVVYSTKPDFAILPDYSFPQKRISP